MKVSIYSISKFITVYCDFRAISMVALLKYLAQ